MARKNIFSTSPFEEQLGFSRAVRVGNHIYVSGTAPIAADGSTACPGDAYGQARRCLEIIQSVLENSGGLMSDVIRTRTYITEASVWRDVGQAHSEFFADVRPVSTMVVVSGLVRDDWMVEIEAEAIVEE
ncbi:MAG TPA: RidA family protein [candidate division Zixibacteria bacterium]|nr:RidA family protein [candidate division Zixibacteria bacterium]